MKRDERRKRRRRIGWAKSLPLKSFPSATYTGHRYQWAGSRLSRLLILLCLILGQALQLRS